MKNEELFFVYGSMTGNAESIARKLHHTAVTEKNYPEAQCLSLNDVVKKKLLDPFVVDVGTLDNSDSTLLPLTLIIVCSTTGEGEPPENASRFRRFLRNLKLKTFSRQPVLRYTVLAIGDTNYNNFCAAGIWIDMRLEELGAIRFYPRGEADDAVDVSAVVEPWSDGVWSAISNGPGSRIGSSASPVGRSTFDPGMSTLGGGNDASTGKFVDLETAIIYANASNVCASLALFLVERIVELGGKADLYPIQYFELHMVKHKPAILVFLLSTDSDEVTICQHCLKSATRLPPLGPFAKLFMPQQMLTSYSPTSVPKLFPSSNEKLEERKASEALREWMSDPDIQYYASLCVVGGRMESAPFASSLNEVVHDVAKSCKLKSLLDSQGTGNFDVGENEKDKNSCERNKKLCRRKDGNSLIAMDEDDLFSWTEDVLYHLPGITADKNSIRMSMDFFFSSRVGVAFASGKEPALSASENPESGSMNPRHRHDDSGVPSNGHRRSSQTNNQTGESHSGKGHVSLCGLLTPLVFLFAGSSSLVAQVACDIQSHASDHHLRSSITELANFKSTGFPRRATFIFIVSGELTKSMVKLLRSLRFLQKEGSSFERVRFAILGIEEVSNKQDASHACTLELEAVLLSLKAEKIHCTGLADGTRREPFVKVVNAWETSLWEAVTHPTPSMAYLDEYSPSIAPNGGTEGSLNNLFQQPNDWFNPSVLPGAASSTNDSEINNVVIRPVPSQSNLFEQTALSPFPRQKPVTTPTSKVPLSVSSPALNPSVGSPYSAFGMSPGQWSGNLFGDSGIPIMAASAPSTSSTGNMQYDSVPLRRENVAYTPILLVYSSPGMAKTMASFTKKLAIDLGFPVRGCALSKLDIQDLFANPNVIFFCENKSGDDGTRGSSSGRLRRQLSNGLLPPDFLSHLRFAILGLGKVPLSESEEHPAVLWSRLLMRLQANRVFPSAYMNSMSMVHSLGIPWTECVLSSLAILPPASSIPPTGGVGLKGLDEVESILGVSSTTDPRILDGYGPKNESNRASEKLVDQVDAPSSASEDTLLFGAVVFLYGSSTGMAESIARDLHREALQRGIRSRVAALQYFHKMNILSSTMCVIVCSSSNANRGGYPDNARRFARYIHHREHTNHSHIMHGARYAVLGLGNAKQYSDTFCVAAVNIDRRMDELGAERVCPLGCVDVSQSIIQSVDQWRQNLFARLDAIIKAELLEKLIPTTSSPGALELSFHPSAQRRKQVCGQFLQKDYASSKSVCFGALVVYAGMVESAALEIGNHLANLLRTELSDIVFPVEVWSMNLCLKKRWRGIFRYIFFVVVCEVSRDGIHIPPNAQGFHRMLQLHSTPNDFFHDIVYSVLSVTSSSSSPSSSLPGPFALGTSINARSPTSSRIPSHRGFAEMEEMMLLGRQLDRRIEELGGFRLYSRGEASNSQQEEVWMRGLSNALRLRTIMDRENQNKTLEKLRCSTEAQDLLPIKLEKISAKNDSTLSPLDRDSQQKICLEATQLSTDSGNRLPFDASASNFIEDDVHTLSDDPNMLACTIHSWRRLTFDSDNASSAEDPSGVFQINFNVPSADVKWVPGQTVSILPPNSITAVEELLDFFSIKFSEPFKTLSPVESPLSPNQHHNSSCSQSPLCRSFEADDMESLFPGSPLYRVMRFPSTCGAVLLRLVSLVLTRHNKAFFDMLLSSAPKYSNPLDEGAQELISGFWEKLRTKTCSAVSLAEVLHSITPRSAVPPFRHVVEHLSLLKPRVYSICSSCLYHTPPLLSLCIRVVPLGVCTHWLYEQCMLSDALPLQTKRVCSELYLAKRNCTIPIVLRPAASFQFPLEEPHIPIICVGPGTGIAPFRAFLQERQARRQLNMKQSKDDHEVEEEKTKLVWGDVELFFGCRRRREDFLFEEELNAFERSGVLSSLQVSFSREPNDGHYWYGGCYVQDSILNSGLGICERLMAQKARVYVCGDASGMAQEVYRAFVEVVQTHLRCSEKSATEFMDQLVQSGRYITECWTPGV